MTNNCANTSNNFDNHCFGKYSITNTTITDKTTRSKSLPQNLQQCLERALRLEASLQLSEGQPSPEPYYPVVGKWMTNLVATTPITAKAMKNLYAKLNKQKDLKRTYHKRYKDLQAVVTTVEQCVMVQQPTVVTGIKVKAAPQVLKAVPGGKNKGATVKEKSKKPLIKGKANAPKSTTSSTSTSAGPALNTRAKAMDKPVVIIHMLQDLMNELQTIEQETIDNEHDSEVTQGSDLEERG